MQLKLTCAIALISLYGFSQNGKIVGTLKDQLTQESLPFASLIIKENQQVVFTDDHGQYEIDLAQGDYTLIFEYAGYQRKEKKIQIHTDQTVEFDEHLSYESNQLDDIIMTVEKAKDRESALLVNQQQSALFQQHIGAQELSKKGISDVAAAVAKTSAVAKEQGGNSIFIRGLGDRYNSTYLNNLPLASDDPENKNINLGIFNTTIVEYVAIDKAYHVQSYGDFAGGNIDIKSKQNNDKQFLDIQLGTNINTNAIQQSDFKRLSGRNSLGFSNNKMPTNPLNTFSFNHKIASQTATPIGMSMAINAATTFFIKDTKLNIFATLNFDNGYKYKQGYSKTVQAQNIFTKDLDLKSYEYNTNSTALFGADLHLNQNNTISYNFLFINDAQEKTDLYKGYIVDTTPDKQNSYSLINRQQYKENRLFVNQLLGQHKLNDVFNLNWGASYNYIWSQTPDRQQYTLNKVINKDSFVFATNARSNNNRYFESLIEKQYSGRVGIDFKFQQNEDKIYKGKLSVGIDAKQSKRDFAATQFVFGITPSHNTNINPSNLDAFFNSANFTQGYFDIYTFRGGADVENALQPQTYIGDLNVYATYGALTYKFNSPLTAILGMRVESITQDVTWQTQLDNTKTSDKLEKTAFLPSIQLKYELSSITNLRLAASKTYTLPQFKERARFIYEDITEVKIGNPDLYASDNYNLDLKWEYFPKVTEVISVTAFGKYIQNPINQIVMASSSNDITFANTGDYGYAIGAELEIKKDIWVFDTPQMSKLSAGLNAAIMSTYQKLDNDKVNRENRYINTLFTHKSAGFTGASGFLMNADLTYEKRWQEASLQATLAYSHFSDKLQSIGTEQSGNIVDKAYGFLDFTLKTQLSDKLGVSFNVKNIINPQINRVQENLTMDVPVQSYKLGSDVSLSISYKF